MAGERIRLEVKDRESRGSAEARRLRRQGLVPGVLYGRGKAPHAFCVEQRELRRALTGPGGIVLGNVTLPTQIVEPEPEEEELEEGAEVPEGEEAPEGAAEAPAEPDAAGSPGTAEG